MKITFVLLHAFGMGGTIRATINLANVLAERHEVEILSVLRHAAAPFFPISPKVRVRSLVDGPGYGPATPRGRRLRGAAHRLPSLLVHPQDRASRSFSPLTDLALIRALRTLDSDVVVSTRAGLNLVVARHAPRRVVRVAQEHLFLAVHRPGILERIRRDYRRLDGVVTLTEADRADYRRLLGGARTRVYVIGNGLPDQETAPRADPAAKVV
ncbi:MAG: glycosyltransferase, partial [Stackebrandtia sp.]